MANAEYTRMDAQTQTYTVRLLIKPRGLRRILKTFIRAEYAQNTSSHATRFDSLEAAERAVDQQAEYSREAGHTFLGADFFKVSAAQPKGGK